MFGNTAKGSNQKIQPFATEVHTKRAYREIKLLKHVDHGNIIKFIDVFSKANDAEEMAELYLVTNFMEADLNEVLYGHCRSLNCQPTPLDEQ